jgi:hypothetical protein
MQKANMLTGTVTGLASGILCGILSTGSEWNKDRASCGKGCV